MHLLGRIDEEKEECEGARCSGGEREGKFRHAVQQGVERGSVDIAPPARARIAPQELHGRESFFAFQPSNHAAQCVGETAYVVVQRDIFGACRWR